MSNLEGQLVMSVPQMPCCGYKFSETASDNLERHPVDRRECLCISGVSKAHTCLVSCSCQARCITPRAGRSMTCFDDLLTAAERALTSLSNGLAPCLYAQRQAKVLQAYSEATRAATTALQRSEAQLSLCYAYLIFAQKDAGTLNSLKCVQQAFSHLTSAVDQASTSAIELAYESCKRSARGALSNPDLDLNDALSFWTRVVSSTAKQVVLKCKLITDEAEWILAYGQRCMAAGSDYKTGLKCGHEAAGPVEVAIQSAQRLKDSGLFHKAEKLKEAIYTFIRCTCESAQVRTHLPACVSSQRIFIVFIVVMLTLMLQPFFLFVAMC